MKTHARQSSQVPDSVRFIDNRLPKLHAGFMHPQINYDPSVGQYVAPSSLPTPFHTPAIPPRPHLKPAETMFFWSEIFPVAMNKLKANDQEPLDRPSTGCSIRQEVDWAGVRSQLERAQGSYELPPRTSKLGGTKGLFTKLYRKAADNSDRWKVGTKVAVHIDYISPVVALVDILLDAASVASDVRNRVCTAFKPEEMEEDFEMIEVSVGLYCGDVNIRNAAVDLVHGIFRAMEDAIGFFMSKRSSRTRDALVQASGYQKALMGKLDDMKKLSAKLVRQVELADMYSTRVGLEKALAAADAGSKQLDRSMKAQQSQADQACSRMLNYIDRVLRDGEERAKERVREAEERAERRCREIKQHFQDELRRISTPSPGHSANASPYLPPQMSAPPSAHLLLPPTMPRFPQLASAWLSPSSAQQYHLQPSGLPVLDITPDLILALLNTTTCDRSDVDHILSQRSLMFPSSVRRSEALLSTHEFRRWLTHSSSQTLLIEGDQDTGNSMISAVSLVSALVYLATRDRKGHIPLFWSCSLHDHGDDDDDYYVDGEDEEEERSSGRSQRKKRSKDDAGPPAMIAAFIAQLVQQYDFDFQSMSSDRQRPSLELVEQRNVKELCALLEWLVRRVPATITVLFLLDDVGHYETDSFSHKGGEEGLLQILRTLFRLSSDKQLACVVKFLVTSADLTDSVAEYFDKNDGLVVDFGSLDEGDGMEECDIGSFDESEDDDD
ncbi:hypothetical protein BJX64DRAFT_287254 [Aspergillus heterothallicus]